MQSLFEDQIIIEEPVEILVNLAKQGEIDPWNVDIIEVTDKFLKKLEEMKKLDLRISARTLLYASILLRMKSEAIVEKSEPVQVEELTGTEPVLEYTDEQQLMLKPVIRRRGKRPVTLPELIEELKKAIEKRDKSELRRKHRREAERIPSTDEVIEIAHDEDIEQRILCLNQFLEQAFQNKETLEFSELLPDQTPKNIVNTYIPLLFMAARKQIWLEQAELYLELYIKRRNDAQ